MAGEYPVIGSLLRGPAGGLLFFLSGVLKRFAFFNAPAKAASCFSVRGNELLILPGVEVPPIEVSTVSGLNFTDLFGVCLNKLFSESGSISGTCGNCLLDLALGVDTLLDIFAFQQ